MDALDKIAVQPCGSNFSYDETFLPDLMYCSWNMLFVWRRVDNCHIDFLWLYHRYELRLRANKDDSDTKRLQNALETHRDLIRVCNEQALCETQLTWLLKHFTTKSETKKAVTTIMTTSTNAKDNQIQSYQIQSYQIQQSWISAVGSNQSCCCKCRECTMPSVFGHLRVI